MTIRNYRDLIAWQKAMDLAVAVYASSTNAHGSIRELETHVMLCERLQFMTDDAARSLLEQCAEVGRLVAGLANSLKH
jgi:hypothetical protein